MKGLIISISILIGVIGYSCQSTSTLSKEQKIQAMTEKIESGRYSFIPQRALPTGGGSVNVNSFELRISKDTIDSYLPYYGRAYSAPMLPDESGIKFVSTDFNYSIQPKNKGMWDVNIETKDTRRKYNMTLKVGDTGYATLIVNGSDRQPISFYGIIE